MEFEVNIIALTKFKSRIIKFIWKWRSQQNFLPDPNMRSLIKNKAIPPLYHNPY